MIVNRVGSLMILRYFLIN